MLRLAVARRSAVLDDVLLMRRVPVAWHPLPRLIAAPPEGVTAMASAPVAG